MSDVHFRPPLAVAEIDKLAALHRVKRFRLATGVGLAGQAHLNGDPEALVTELIRLARAGAALLQAADRRPNARLGPALRHILEEA